MPELRIEVRGHEALIRKLRGRPLFAGPLRDALDEAGSLALRHAQERVPRGRGVTASRLKKQLHAAPVPLWAKVSLSPMPTARGRAGRRFRYPGALEGGARYHYRSGAHHGQTTRHWLSGVLPLIRQRVEHLLGAAGRQIEQAWQRL